ncbi:MAG TPA: TIGR01777 family oxidoreductase [Terriglobales bacterium]|jgi:hypothetical protein
MRVLVAGASGLIGGALSAAATSAGDEVVRWGRSDRREELPRVLAGCGGVVNLAGAPILGPRWTEARRLVLRRSRVEWTAALVEAMAAANPRPQVLVNASAVGYYGDRGAEALTEDAPPGEGFLAGLCRDWEAAARGAEALGVRVVCLRTGVVLARNGGALQQMLPAFRLGLGGPIGDGRQYFPWIHLDDEVAIIRAALGNAQWRGPLNAAAPEAVTSREFARALGRALHRPAILPTPRAALRLLYGDAASVLFASQRVLPAALTAGGFAFRYPRLDAALTDLAAS